jgi:hypothetical protein
MPKMETPPPAGRRLRIVFASSSEHPNITDAPAGQYAVAWLIRHYALSPRWALLVAKAAGLGGER